METIQPTPKVIEAEAIGGPFCGSQLVGYRATLLARANHEGPWHCYALTSDEGGWIWRYVGIHTP